MRILLYTLLILVTTSVVQAQDTLQTRILSEVVIQSVQTEADTLQNFYRANRSANTEDILSRMNGVYLIRRSAYGQEPVIRGMSGGQINVTIDGMRMFSACTDKMDPVTIYVEPQNLKSIDASLGTNGSLMGSTIGGSLNLRLAEPLMNQKSITGRAGAGYQSVSNGINYFADANFSQQNSAYRASVIYRKSQNYKDGLGQTVNFSQFEKTNFSLAGKWNIKRDTLKANFLIDEGKNLGFPALPMDVGKARASIYALSYIRHTDSGWLKNLEAKVYANEVYHQMDDSQREVLMHMDMPGWSDTYGAYAEAKLREINNNTLQIRSDIYHNRVLAEMVMYPSDGASMYMQTWPSSYRTVSGIYAADDIKLPGRLKVNINARLDVSNTTIEEGFGKDQLYVFYPEFSSSTKKVTKSINATARKPMLNNFVLTLHGGYGERLPTNAELYGFYLFNRQDIHDYMGNPHLKVEKSYASDFGIEFFNDWLELSGTAFYQYNPNYILAYVDTQLDAMTPGANGVKVYENISSTKFWGTELSALISPVKNIQLITSFKGTRAETFAGDPLPFIPAFKNVTSLRIEKNKLSGQLEWEGALAQTHVSENFGEQNTPDYSIFNIRAGYHTKNRLGQWNFSLGIENLADTYYREHLDWGGIPRPGRNFYSTVEFRF
ncbi:MAG: TonB-dependent receptor [Cyclobacteriaceae bacterium]